MAPIRVGIIGLSTSAKTSWASSAHLPYLKSVPDKYVITALCNTSVASAQRSIAAFDLPPTTKAYGDVHDLAKDPDVDLVVCNTRVDVHYPTIRPSVEAGKNVFVEWPLGANVEQAKDLTELVRQKGVKSVVGIQGRMSPIVTAVKGLLDSNRIGKVLSSSVNASGGSRLRDVLPEGLKYFADRKVGGNYVTIGFAHMIDYIHFTLGSEYSSLTSHLHLLRPKVPIIGPGGNVIEVVTSDVPDLINVNGVLTSNVPLDVRFRRGQPFSGYPGFEWLITGEDGEIRVSGQGPALNAFDQGIKVELFDFKTDQVEQVKWNDDLAHLPIPARNIGRLYELLAKGVPGSYPDFHDALRRHEEIQAVFDSSEQDKRVSYQ